jgi:hypothetical protein
MRHSAPIDAIAYSDNKRYDNLPISNTMSFQMQLGLAFSYQTSFGAEWRQSVEWKGIRRIFWLKFMLNDLITECCNCSHSRCQMQEQTSQQKVSEESDTIENNLLGLEKQTGKVI